MPSKLNLPAVAARRRRSVLLRASLGTLIAACTALLIYYAGHHDIWSLSGTTPGPDRKLNGTWGAAPSFTAAEQRQRLFKPCARGCEKHGNCNFEEGRCE